MYIVDELNSSLTTYLCDVMTFFIETHVCVPAFGSCQLLVMLNSIGKHEIENNGQFQYMKKYSQPRLSKVTSIPPLS